MQNIFVVRCSSRVCWCGLSFSRAYSRATQNSFTLRAVSLHYQLLLRLCCTVQFNLLYVPVMEQEPTELIALVDNPLDNPPPYDPATLEGRFAQMVFRMLPVASVNVH